MRRRCCACAAQDRERSDGGAFCRADPFTASETTGGFAVRRRTMFARLMGLSTISPLELHQRMQDEAVTTIDVNSRQSWLSARVPRAIHLDPLTFQANDLPADREGALVFYCSNVLCRKAPNAARRAETMGYRRVQVMAAGISGWLRAGLPAQSGEEG